MVIKIIRFGFACRLVLMHLPNIAPLPVTRECSLYGVEGDYLAVHVERRSGSIPAYGARSVLVLLNLGDRKEEIKVCHGLVHPSFEEPTPALGRNLTLDQGARSRRNEHRAL